MSSSGIGRSSGSAYVDRTAGAVEHCEAMAAAFPDLADRYYNPMARYCQSKLWHQLTMVVLEFVHENPATVTRTTPTDGTHAYLALYDRVVLAVDSKLNPLALSRIAAAVAIALAPTDMIAAKAVLENLIAKQETLGLGVPATCFLTAKLSLLSLQTLLVPATTTTTTTDSNNNNSNNTDEEARKQQLATAHAVMKKNAAIVNEMMVGTNQDSDQAIVQAAHYEQAMCYYKVTGPPEAFYEQAMNFLNYAPLFSSASAGDDDSSQQQQQQQHLQQLRMIKIPGSSLTYYYQLAVDLCVAALTGEGVYNLGQVEQTPILQILGPGSPDRWLVDALHAIATGSVVEFRDITQRHATEIQAQPALVHRSAALTEKLTLLSLVHLVFEKGSHERTLRFDEIAERAMIPLEEVELVLMRAFSVQLLRGSIDQVEQRAKITWVMPRVLRKDQLADLATRFGEWAGRVGKMRDYMHEQTHTTFFS